MLEWRRWGNNREETSYAWCTIKVEAIIVEAIVVAAMAVDAQSVWRRWWCALFAVRLDATVRFSFSIIWWIGCIIQRLLFIGFVPLCGGCVCPLQRLVADTADDYFLLNDCSD